MKPNLWSADQLASICNAKWQGPAADVSGIAYLPRRVQSGDLFVALKSEGTDHHQNIRKALSRGASAAMVSRIPGDLPSNTPLLRTNHMRKSLRQLAIAGRERSAATFFGITGRVGKTFTKDTLTHLLGLQGSVSATQGNDNDTNGVSITLARVPRSSDFAVLEISMAMFGDIANSVLHKSAVVRPDVAIITRISNTYGSDAKYRHHNLDVAQTKSGILDGLVPGGSVVLNRDDQDVFEYLYNRASALDVNSVCTYGEHREANVRLVSAARTGQGFDISINLFGKAMRFCVGVNGGHLIENILAVIGALDAAGADVELAVQSLTDVCESPGRGNRYTIKTSKGIATLLDYSRNATMPAVQASLRTLAELNPAEGSRRIAVLGDLTELPDNATPFHIDIARLCDDFDIDLVFATGTEMKHMYDALPRVRRGAYSDDSDALAKEVQRFVQNGDVVLIQGWRQLRLFNIVKKLVGNENYVPWW